MELLSRRLTLLHLGNELLVEQAAGLLVKRAVDGDDIALCKHLLEVLDPSAANLLLLLRRKRLVIEVEELLAVKCLEAAEHTLANAADGDSTDDLVLEIVLVLRHGGDVPVTGSNLLVGGHKVADEDQDGHDDVLSDGDDVGARDLSDRDAAIGGVCGVEVDVVGTDTSSHGKLELLGLCETLGGEVTGVESGVGWLAWLFPSDVTQEWEQG